MDPWFQALRYANCVSVTNKTLETMLLWFHRAFIAPHLYAKLIQISCVSRIQSQSSGLFSEGMVQKCYYYSLEEGEGLPLNVSRLYATTATLKHKPL